MHTHFSKYHGTGNDFILIDDRSESFDISNTHLIEKMCSRRFGIGADGLILLREKDDFDFEMVYFNSDGNQSSMCGNGGRCIVHFAHSLGLFDSECTFLAIDGAHNAKVIDKDIVKLKMGNVDNIERDGEAYVLNTGSPHFVKKVNDVNQIDIRKEGALIRYSEAYAKDGINVNFLECIEGGINVATYERGVEDETYSCGTGVTAGALAIHEMYADTYPSPVQIHTKGGELLVFFTKIGDNKYSDIWLQGPAKKTFKGVW
jgi:diaminopimelate epimerase